MNKYVIGIVAVVLVCIAGVGAATYQESLANYQNKSISANNSTNTNVDDNGGQTMSGNTSNDKSKDVQQANEVDPNIKHVDESNKAIDHQSTKTISGYDGKWSYTSFIPSKDTTSK